MTQNTNQDINFLSSDQASKIEIQEDLRNSIKKAGLILTAWLLIISAVLGYGFILSSKNNSLKKEAQRLDQQLVQLNDKITMILLLKDRLEKIGQIFDQRQDLSKPLNNFFTNLPSGISLNKVNLTQKTMEVVGTGDILSISRLAQVYTAQEQDWYQGATLKSLVKNEKDTTFTFSLLVDL